MPPPEALVSLVMPCRNAGPMLRPALASAIGQTYPHLEIIFVDDGSSDGSRAIAEDMAKSCARSVTVATAPGRGVNVARNHGLSLARGDYVQWLDADDEIAPSKIALQVAVLEADPAMDIAYGDWTTRLYAKDGTMREGRRYLKPAADQIRRTLSLAWYPSGIFLLRRRAADLLAREQGWWPGRPVATDIEYFALAALLGLKFIQVPDSLGIYNIWSPQQISAATPYSLRAMVLKAIYARLVSIAERPDVRGRVRPAHRRLLSQNWDVWALARGSIEQSSSAGGNVTLRHRTTGKTLDVRPREAAVIALIERDDEARFLAHHATEAMARAPDHFADHAEVIFLLERFRRAGLLTRIATSPPPLGSRSEVFY